MQFVFSNIRRRVDVVGAPQASLDFEYDGGDGDESPNDEVNSW